MALQGYLLPQNRYIDQPAAVAAPAQVAPPALALPALNDNYANVQGISDEFINTVGQLKSYAHDMAKTYGIDVTKPDYSQPGGGQPYRTFQELSAKSIMTGNDLKQRMLENQAINKGVLEGTVLGQGDYEQAPLDASIQERAVSTALLPEVKQAAEALMRVYDTPQGAQRANAAFKAPLVQKLTTLIANDPQNAQFYQRQIDALPNAVHEPPIFAPSAGDAGKAEKRKAIVDLYKRTTNLIKGAFDDNTFEATLDDNFNPVYKNSELSGVNLGQKSFVVKKQKKTYPLIVDGISLRDGKTYLQFQQPEEAQRDNFSIPEEDITGTKGDLFLKRMIENNKAMGLNTTELVTALKEADLYESTGSKDEKVVLKNLVRKPSAQMKAQVDKARKELKDTLIKTPRSNQAIQFINDGGQTVSVVREFFNPPGTPHFKILVDGEEQVGNSTAESVEKWLKDNTEYFTSILRSAESSSASDAEKRADELLQKYGQ